MKNSSCPLLFLFYFSFFLRAEFITKLIGNDCSTLIRIGEGKFRAWRRSKGKVVMSDVITQTTKDKVWTSLS